MKCSRKGRFTVTEELSVSPRHFAPAPAAAAAPSPAALPPGVCEKRGRFRVFTACLSCDSTATKYDDLDEVCQPFVTVQQQQQLEPLRDGFKLDACDSFLARSGSSSCSSDPPSVSTPVKAAAAVGATTARPAPDAPRRWRDQDAAFVGSSWESASSGLSSTLSMDSSSRATPGAKPHGRRVRFSDCGGEAPLQAAVSVPTTPSGAAAIDFMALLSSSSIAELPRSVTKCYQRGRFMVEEGVLSPCLSGSHVLPSPTAPSPTQPLHRSTSMPVQGTAGTGQHWRTLATVMDLDESLGSSESGCSAVPMDADRPPAAAAAGPAAMAARTGAGAGRSPASVAPAAAAPACTPWAAAAPAVAAAAPMAVDSAQDSFTELLVHKGQASPRPNVVSYVRRGRFLVQTYL